jgi:hypothetical protein
MVTFLPVGSSARRGGANLIGAPTTVWFMTSNAC